MNSASFCAASARFERPRWRWLRLAATLALVVLVVRPASAEEEASAIEHRLTDACRYLASEQLEGRKLGDKGIDLAAEFIAGKFVEYGLKTDLFDGKPLQKFPLALGSQLGKENRLALVGPPPKEGEPPQRIELRAGADFNPIAMSGSATFDLPLVFAGYGITAPKEGYDDYAGIDVKGKMVVVLRHEPQQDDEKSVFDGKRDSAYAPLPRKVEMAAEHGAAGVLFCTDEFELRKNLTDFHKKWQESLDRVVAAHEKLHKAGKPSREQIQRQRAEMDKLLAQVQRWNKMIEEGADPVLPPSYGGPGDVKDAFPVLHCRRAPVEKIVRAAMGTDLAAIEAEIDRGPKPHSGPLDGWRAAGRADLQRRNFKAQNVVAVLEGRGPNAGETIVLGAHYDHLGTTEQASKGVTTKTIRPGADDNASGVAVLLEVARALALRPERLPRRVVFAAFTGEEMGLLGSRHYTQHPPVPLDQTIAMVNLDMVGRLRDERLTVTGTGTARLFDEILGKVGADGMKVQKVPAGQGPSDHLIFYGKNVPVLHFFTGTHGDLHRPSDKPELLNASGMRRIARMVEEVVAALAAAPQRPKFVATPPSAPPRVAANRAFLGVVPDMNHGGDGFQVIDILEGGPADKAGLKSGDRIIEFDGRKVAGTADFMDMLGKHKPGDKVKTVVHRGDKTLPLEVTLDKPR